MATKYEALVGITLADKDGETVDRFERGDVVSGLSEKDLKTLEGIGAITPVLTKAEQKAMVEEAIKIDAKLEAKHEKEFPMEATAHPEDDEQEKDGDD